MTRRDGWGVLVLGLLLTGLVGVGAAHVLRYTPLHVGSCVVVYDRWTHATVPGSESCR